MSEMIERLAADFSRKSLEGCEDDGRIEACDPKYCRCRFFARAAIEAMREPTAAMRQVVSADWGRRTWKQYGEAIDAALKPSE